MKNTNQKISRNWRKILENKSKIWRGFGDKFMLNKKLQQQIIQAKDIDQKARFDCKPGKLTMKNYTVYLVDLVNNDLIKRVIKQHGYPTQKMIGEKGMQAFWLLVQHQDNDIDLQKQCLKRCDFEPKNVAFLTDRILLAENKKQKFGTQYMIKNNKLVIRPVVDVKNLNKRRIECDLNTVEEQTKIINKNYAKKLKK